MTNKAMNEGEGPTILCVDDDPLVLAALQRVLRAHGCRVLTADSGPAALERLRDETIEVLICDESMPGMRGIEVLRQARTVAPPVVRILLTAHCGSQDVVIPAINQGEIFRLLSKPWNDEELCRCVSEALGAEPTQWRQTRRRLQERLRGACYGTPHADED